MKSKVMKIIGIIVILLLVAALAVGTFFYISLSGNPITKYLKKKEVLKQYSVRYGKEFKVLDSGYDFKRTKYYYTLSPLDKPEITFKVEADTDLPFDYYGKALAENELKVSAIKALGDEFKELNYRVTPIEEYTEVTYQETDAFKRISENSYTIYISWDSEKNNNEELEKIAERMADKIKPAITYPVKELSLDVGVFDKASDYFSKTIKLKN